jgi:hypothetical protein
MLVGECNRRDSADQSKPISWRCDSLRVSSAARFAIRRTSTVSLSAPTLAPEGHLRQQPLKFQTDCSTTLAFVLASEFLVVRIEGAGWSQPQGEHIGRERVRRKTTMTGQAIPFRDWRRLPGFQRSCTRFIGAPSLALRVPGLRLDSQMLGILRQLAPDCSASAPAREACQAKTSVSPKAPPG